LLFIIQTLKFTFPKSKFIVRTNPIVPITKKGTLVRMGKGKGKIVDYKALAPKNFIILIIKILPTLSNIYKVEKALNIFPLLKVITHRYK
jgi:ribosomal protein L16/L10AE